MKLQNIQVKRFQRLAHQSRISIDKQAYRADERRHDSKKLVGRLNRYSARAAGVEDQPNCVRTCIDCGRQIFNARDSADFDSSSHVWRGNQTSVTCYKITNGVSPAPTGRFQTES